jgi:enolase
VLVEGIAKAGYNPSENISIRLDPTASEMWENGKYALFKSTKQGSAQTN